MLMLIGAVVVILTVIGGFALEGGNVNILIQPVEATIVFGVALGAFLIANPPNVVRGVVRAIPEMITQKGKNKKDYLALLIFLFHLLSKMRRDGVLAVEDDVNSPAQSELFKKYGSVVLRSRNLTRFLCDNLKAIISGSIAAPDMDNLMDIEIETQHQDALILSQSVARTADAMPGLGLVAAVLGVVLTMHIIDKPANIIGHSIAIALLGTFIGILGCYGFIAPLATSLEHKANDDIIMFKVIKIALVAALGGSVPMMAVEFARKTIPLDCRPSFEELDTSRRSQDTSLPPPAAASVSPETPAAAT